MAFANLTVAHAGVHKAVRISLVVLASLVPVVHSANRPPGAGALHDQIKVAFIRNSTRIWLLRSINQ